MFRVFTNFILQIFLVFSFLLIPTSSSNDVPKKELTQLSNNLEDSINTLQTEQIDSSLVSSSIYSCTRYSNVEVANPFIQDELVNFNVVSYGGIHNDGYGKRVYSNYVGVDINFLYDYTLITQKAKINDNTYVHYMLERSIPGNIVGQSENYKLKSYVGYGVLIVSRENADGTREDIRPIYLKKNKTTDTIYVTEDGNYHFTIYLLTSKYSGLNQVCTTIDYVVPVRTSCYLKSVRNNMDVKNLEGNKGIYYDDFRIDLMNRKNVIIKINNNFTKDGYVFTDENIYDIEIYGNGFLSEKFEFELSRNPSRDLIVNFSNIRRKVSAYTYEAENNFRVTWNTRYYNLIPTYLYNDSKEAKTFHQDECFTKPGVYMFMFKIPNLRTHIYTIVLEGDKKPMHNYSVLSGRRFNNFISKWYELYDETNELYYCFSIHDYKMAYDASISLENDKVEKRGSQFVYNDQIFNTKFELTEVLNNNAKNNIKLKYYDMDDEHVEKLFLPKCFEEKIYLNKDFVFVSLHPSESASVTLRNISTNEIIYVDYLKKIEEYNLETGIYEVTEEDIYGNKQVYQVTYDTTSPDVNIKTDSIEKTVDEGEEIICNYFSIDELIDEFDDYSVIAVNDEYYLKNELDNAIFSLPGEYNVRAYDRNNNKTSFKVTISSENKLFNLIEENNQYKINLTNGTNIEKVIFNGEEIELKELTIDKFDEKGTYFIYLKNSDKDDIVRLNVFDKEDNKKVDGPYLKENVTDNSQKIKKITTISISVVAGIGFILLVILIIHPNKDYLDDEIISDIKHKKVKNKVQKDLKTSTKKQTNNKNKKDSKNSNKKKTNKSDKKSKKGGKK